VLLVQVYLFRHKMFKDDASGGGGSKEQTSSHTSSFFIEHLLQSINSVLSNLSERHARKPLFDALLTGGSTPPHVVIFREDVASH